MQRLINKIHILIFSFVFAIMMGGFFVTFSDNPNIHDWREEKFDLAINDKVYENIDVDSFNEPHLKRNDVVHIRKTIGNAYRGDTLVFRTYGSAVEVRLDGELIYSYGQERYRENKMIGRGYHFINFENLEPETSDLDIKLTAGEDMSYMWVDFIKFNTGNTIWIDILSVDKFAIIISLFMFSLGSIGFVSALFIYSITNSMGNIYHILYSFSTIFFVGLWNASVCGLLQLISNNMELVAFMEYATLYIAAFFYFGSIEIIQKNNKFGILIRVEKWLYFVFVIAILFMHFTNRMFISQSIATFRIVVVAVVSMAFLIVLSNYRKQKLYEKILRLENILGLVLLLINAGLHSISIYSIKVLNQSFNISNILISIAILISVTSPLLSHLIRSGEIEVFENQVALLNKIAYKDSLTGLDNRHGARAYVMNLENNEIPYYVIMMDLNNLKKVNDALGHERGDKLLIDCADCIKATFNEDCICVRQGGDEFVVVLRDVDGHTIESYLDKLQENVDRVNSKIHDGGFISIAVGIAGSYEIKDGDYDSVLNLADERMYENKARSKEAAAMAEAEQFQSPGGYGVEA